MNKKRFCKGLVDSNRTWEIFTAAACSGNFVVTQKENCDRPIHLCSWLSIWILIILWAEKDYVKSLMNFGSWKAAYHDVTWCWDESGFVQIFTKCQPICCSYMLKQQFCEKKSNFTKALIWFQLIISLKDCRRVSF